MPPRRSSRPVAFRLITADADLRDGIRALRRKCAVIRAMHDLAGDPPLRRREAGFEGLARIVISQQVSVASATAIWDRFAACVEPMNAAGVLARTDDELRAAGLSRPKIKTMRAISSAVVAGELRFDGLDRADDCEVHAALTQISGIGPWTADVYLLFCLGRADAFAAGDLALQEAARGAFGLADRPNHLELLELAERWRPWRGVAARLLWAYYKVLKDREGVTN